MADLAWQMTACGLGTLFLIRLILAPWWMHRKQEEEIANAQKQLAETRDEVAEKDAVRLKQQLDSEKKALAHARLNKLRQRLETLIAERRASYPTSGGQDLSIRLRNHAQETKDLLAKWLIEARKEAIEISLDGYLPVQTDLDDVQPERSQVEKFAQLLDNGTEAILRRLA